MLPKRAQQIKPIDPELPQRSIKIVLGLNDESTVAGGLSSIKPYSYRRASNPHGSDSLHCKRINDLVATEVDSTRPSIATNRAIIESSFAAIAQVWGKIGAVIMK